jgi:hypothetical protein
MRCRDRRRRDDHRQDAVLEAGERGHAHAPFAAVRTTRSHRKLVERRASVGEKAAEAGGHHRNE